MTATAAPPLEDQIAAKLAGKQPLKLAEVAADLPPLKGKAKTAREAELKRHLADAVGEGRAFSRPTGPSGAERYWHRDEYEAVADAILAAADQPQTEAVLKRAGQVPAKSPGPYAQTVMRELIAAGRLHRAPGTGAARYANEPPKPPEPVSPLKRPAVARKVKTLAGNFDKLLTEAGVSAAELFAAVRALLTAPGAGAEPEPPKSAAREPEPVARSGQPVDLAALIFEHVERADSVLSLADVRAAMPAGHQGQEFDAAVFELAKSRKVRIYQDNEAAALSPEARARLVEDEDGNVFRTIMRATL